MAGPGTTPPKAFLIRRYQRIGDSEMSLPGIRSLLAITATAWLAQPAPARPIAEVRAPTAPDYVKKVKEEGFMPSSRLNCETRPPTDTGTGKKGNEMKRQTVQRFIATTRTHWLDTSVEQA